MKSPNERKTEVTQGALEDIRKNKGHHHEKVTSTYKVSPYDERGPGKVSCQFSCQPAQKSWGKQELLRAPVHKEGLFLKAKGHTNYEFPVWKEETGKLNHKNSKNIRTQTKNDSLEQSSRFLSHFRENLLDSVSFIFSFHCIIKKSTSNSEKVKVTHRYEAIERLFLPWKDLLFFNCLLKHHKLKNICSKT